MRKSRKTKFYCKWCEKTADLSSDEFPKYGRQCKNCRDERVRAWRKENPERHRINRKRAGWKQAGISITLEEYETMVKDQQGKCKICGVIPDGIELAVDHDHETGRIRGLLCSGCNRTLSWVERNWIPLMDYLEEK